MARNLINRYIWIIDTIERYGSITRETLNELWMQSSLGDGEPMARRTFYSYRNAIAETFGIVIECNPRTYEYYIDHDNSANDHRRQRWMIDSMALSGMLSDAADVASRIVLEEVPSAREHLPTVIDAMRQNKRLRFDYRPYTRLSAKTGVVIEPYFVKIFRQVWYVIGYNVQDDKIKTYALDRITNLNIDAGHTFQMPPEFSPKAFFQDCFGITTSNRPPQRIVLRVEPTQAKYFRALPLHHSQIEVVHDNYSIFTYRMCVTYDLRERLLSHGSNVEILEPQSLRTVIAGELEAALRQYRTSAQ